MTLGPLVVVVLTFLSRAVIVGIYGGKVMHGMAMKFMFMLFFIILPTTSTVIYRAILILHSPSPAPAPVRHARARTRARARARTRARARARTRTHTRTPNSPPRWSAAFLSSPTSTTARAVWSRT